MKFILSAFFSFCTILSFSQVDLPREVNITSDGILKHGGTAVQGFYDIEAFHKIEFTLEDPNWFSIMDGQSGGGPGGGGPGGQDTEGELLMGTLTVNDSIVLDSVMIGIKGQTSDRQNRSEKKSFKVLIDELKDQNLMGYDNINLNCAFDDHSSMREVLYYDISRGFAPSLKGSFVDLYINGQYWGPYNNIQQLEGRYIQEWFRNNDGTRWRALNSENTGGPGGGGPGGDPARFGAGVSTLNYNGPDSIDYNLNYELKKTESDDPWGPLINVCDVLNNTPIDELYNALNPVLDIDRTLWILAQEIVASDDDGYFFKGGMDYYVYYDDATGRLMPLEVDGNSVMNTRNDNWSPFYREDDDRWPLINRMMQNEEIRQRYLAHLRTVLTDFYNVENVHARIDAFAAKLDQKIQDDPKKIYSYNQFTFGVEELKTFISDRVDFLLAHEEINREGVNIISTSNVSNSETAIVSGETVAIETTIEGNAQQVILHYASGLDGHFEKVIMYDDGSNGDNASGDNIYTGSIPGFNAGTYVRYYIEAIKEDNFGTANYFPKGAEHECFLYQVQPSFVEGEIVINEFMASNSSTAMDASGAFGDWIELYNKGTETVNLTGYFISDDETVLDRWAFPDNTELDPDEYLIVWADDDEEDTTIDELHTNFKLSAGGEQVILINDEGNIIDMITYDEQQTDISFARIPNGTGDFEFRTETFAANNDGSISDTKEELTAKSVLLYPNPADLEINIFSKTNSPINLTIYNSKGQLIKSLAVKNTANLNISEFSEGLYNFVFGYENKMAVSRKVMVIK